MTMTEQPVFRVGDRALLRYGCEDVEVEVIEALGPVGFRGRRLVRIRMPVPAMDDLELTLPEVDLRGDPNAA